LLLSDFLMHLIDFDNMLQQEMEAEHLQTGLGLKKLSSVYWLDAGRR
jgi:hypothetical protein